MTYRHSEVTLIKFLFYGINLLLVIAGVIVISVAGSVYALYNDFSNFSHPYYFSSISIMIASAVLIMVVALLGYYGVVKEKSCILLLFTGILSLLTLMELCAALIVSSSQNDITSSVSEQMWQKMHAYQSNNNTAKMLDTLQKQFACCGAKNAIDWTTTLKKGTLKGDLPVSCCKVTNGVVGQFLCNVDKKNFYDKGCLDVVAHYIGSDLYLLGNLGIGIVVVEVLSIVYSIYLALRMRRYGR